MTVEIGMLSVSFILMSKHVCELYRDETALVVSGARYDDVGRTAATPPPRLNENTASCKQTSYDRVLNWIQNTSASSNPLFKISKFVLNYL